MASHIKVGNVDITYVLDMLPPPRDPWAMFPTTDAHDWERSEEHTSELQSRRNFVCRFLLEK